MTLYPSTIKASLDTQLPNGGFDAFLHQIEQNHQQFQSARRQARTAPSTHATLVQAAALQRIQAQCDMITGALRAMLPKAWAMQDWGITVSPDHANWGPRDGAKGTNLLFDHHAVGLAWFTAWVATLAHMAHQPRVHPCDEAWAALAPRTKRWGFLFFPIHPGGRVVRHVGLSPSDAWLRFLARGHVCYDDRKGTTDTAVFANTVEHALTRGSQPSPWSGGDALLGVLLAHPTAKALPNHEHLVRPTSSTFGLYTPSPDPQRRYHQDLLLDHTRAIANLCALANAAGPPAPHTRWLVRAPMPEGHRDVLVAAWDAPSALLACAMDHMWRSQPITTLTEWSVHPVALGDDQRPDLDHVFHR